MIDRHSEITLTVTQDGKTYEYFFPKVSRGDLTIEPDYPDGYWDPFRDAVIAQGITGCHVSLKFFAVSNDEGFYARVKTDPPLVSRRHPPKKRTR